jgi:phosphatidate cytidylyltransferase
VLRWRLAAAAVILIPLIALFVADYRWNAAAPGIWLVVPGLIMSWVAAAEVLDLARAFGARPLGWPVYAGTAAIFLAACLPMAAGWLAPDMTGGLPGGEHSWLLLAVVLAIALAFVGEMARYEPGTAVMGNLSLSILAALYVGIPFAFTALIRQFHSNAWGMAALVSVIFVVKLSDTGAYFAGKSWGKRKLAPRLSPGKTIEGGIGGLLAAVAASLVYFQFLAPWLTGDRRFLGQWGGAITYGIALGLVGVLGDLSESLLKRDAGRKDSSRWLPGLGGVLDIVDSLLFAFPTAYVWWGLGLVGPG